MEWKFFKFFYFVGYKLEAVPKESIFQKKCTFSGRVHKSVYTNRDL